MKILLFLILAISTLLAVDACGQKSKIPKPPAGISNKELSNYRQATFAAGCFWHEEALFESLKGVKEVISGYAGGNTPNPTYESIESGNAGHAETVNIYYNSTVITYPTLLKIFFAAQDPTQVNGQGNGRGTQYRSIVFYRNKQESDLIRAYIKSIQKDYSNPIAVQVKAFDKFWEAEKYHQNYIANNPYGGYVQAVSIPEIKHLQKEYPELIKPDHFY
jgi:peptide-methionine (S)-S-oxide reductase